MTTGIPSNGPVFHEFQIDPSLNQPPLNAPNFITAFAHKSLRELKGNPRGVIENAKPFTITGFAIGAMAVGSEMLPLNILTGIPLVAIGLLAGATLALDELDRQQRGIESVEGADGFSVYTEETNEERTSDKVNTAVQTQWVGKIEDLTTNPAKLDEKVFRESISQGKIPDIFKDAILLTTIETPVAFTGDPTNLIFDLESLNMLKNDAKTRNVTLTHPLTRQVLDFDKLVYLPEVKKQIEEAKEKVKE